ncbi:MAG TPA: hypothetical protein G4O02_18115 [Caldilineae bacterium]|nr:hypothetical protein [Caldilineae bacterium]
MTEPCPFLEPMQRPAEGHTHGCKAGLNFYSVSPGYALCRTCPVPELVSEPICEHLVVYTRLRTDAGGRRYIEAELDCDLSVEMSATGERCGSCPLSRAEDGYPLIIDLLSRSSIIG